MRLNSPARLLFFTGIVLLPACDSTPPTGQSASLSFSKVVAGATHTCAFTTAGETFCWGRAGEGALGTDSLLSTTVPTPVAARGFTFAALSAGDDFTCGVTPAGESYCWGANTHGQLGIGNRVDAAAPQPLRTTTVFKEIATGAEHTCALNAAGDIFCWGRADRGQLGAGILQDGVAPTTRVGYNHLYVSVTAGNYHACGLMVDQGIRCWGWNTFGQDGNATTITLSFPETVIGDRHYSAVSAGSEHTCAVTTDGAAYCWGRGDGGQLGDGLVRNSTAPVAVMGNIQFRTIDGGMQHTCGIATDGRAYCWGTNSDGQIGNGTAGGVFPTPTLVAGNLRFAQISAGGLHTCGVTTDRAVYCWGFGGFGQLGTGVAVSETQPTRTAR